MPEPTTETMDEMVRLLNATLRANAVRITSSRGGYIGGGQPHATLESDTGSTEAVARGLLARLDRGQADRGCAKVAAEARRAVLTTLREQVEGQGHRLVALPGICEHRWRNGQTVHVSCPVAAVLAEIDRLMPEDKPEEATP